MSISRYKITPTPSNTPSNTPTITPSLSSCPTLYYFQPQVSVCNEFQPEVLDLSGFSMTFNGVEYNNLTQFVPLDYVGTFCNVGPAILGTTGTTYRFDFRIDNPNWELCEAETVSGITYDRIDIILTDLVSTPAPNTIEWNCIVNYYLNDVLQASRTIDTIFYNYPTSDNPNCPNIFLAQNQLLTFEVRERLTPTTTPSTTPTRTPTSTPTITPSPTFCATPRAVLVFDGNSGSTALNAWMASQGSAFRGLNTNNPSTVQSTFQAQMNAYINYTGFGTTTYAIIQSGITYNQDPIVLTNSVNNWTGDQTWVSYFVPTCIHCPGSYTLMGEATPSYVVNSVWTSRPFYYSGTVIPQGQYIFYSTKPASGVNFFNSNSQYSLGSLVCTGITPTMTSTPTITPTTTPSMTQTQTNTGTLTSTPTNTSTPTRSPEITPSMTQTNTPTNTSTPSSTPVCQQIFLYPDNTNACDHLGTLTQYDTDSSLSPTILYVNGGCGTTPVAGNNLWFSQGAGATSYQVNNSGVIINTFNCP